MNYLIISTISSSKKACFYKIHQLKKNKRTGFIWITDGEGWLTAKHPLREAFEHIDYIMNINMLEQGLLEEILVKG